MGVSRACLHASVLLPAQIVGGNGRNRINLPDHGLQQLVKDFFAAWENVSPDAPA